MIFLRNLVLQLNDNALLNSGKYRILEIYKIKEKDILCMYELESKVLSSKPVLIDLHYLKQCKNEGVLSIEEDILPYEMTLDDEHKSDAVIFNRDNDFSLIEDLVDDRNFLLQFCSNSRSALVSEHAKKKKVRSLKIYRLLRKYWEYGQTSNSLLLRYSNRGGPGVEKTVSDKQRGAPIHKGKYNLRKKASVNITSEDKENIKNSVDKCISKYKKFKLSRAYKLLIEDYFGEEVNEAKRNQRPAQVPSKRQFMYWAYKVYDKNELLKKRVSTSVWKKDHKGIISSVSDKAKGPGTRYEIDATVADVFIVSEFDRNIILGRPTIYSVVDQASRMIAGLHVSLDFASWTAARQALYNACNEKVNYCKRYGLDVTHSDWPCVGVPARLLCDRGEMIGIKPRILPKGLGTKFEFASPFRGDCKSIVERRFGIANDELHFLPGTTLGELRKRGEKDPRLDAVLTLNEVAKILVALFIKHNKWHQFDDLVTKGLVSADLAPTPQNFWNFHIEKHQHSLNALSANQFVALLMKKGKASVTKKGIIYNGMRYSCELAEKEEWYSKARNFGRWKIECRSDESWSNDFYIRMDNSKEFIKCYLLSADKIYGNQHVSDIIYISEWKKSKKDQPDRQQADIDQSCMVNDIVENALKIKKDTPRTKSKTASLSSIRKNRRDEIKRTSHISNNDVSNREEIASRGTANKDDQVLMLLNSISDDNE